jgi:hypothetical protein
MRLDGTGQYTNGNKSINMKTSKDINILVIGQSNATSYNAGLVTTPLTERIQQWDIATQRFKKMQQGYIRQYAGASGVNPSSYPACFRFAELMQNHTGQRINVLLLAIDGSSITDWQSGQTAYDNMVTQVGHSKVDQIDYVLFQQGEANGGMANATYYTNMLSTFSSLRAEAFCNNCTPIIIGLVPMDFNLGYLNVEAGQIKAAQFENDNIYVADSVGLNHIGDTVHFDAASQKILGERMFKSLFNDTVIKRTTTQRDDMGFAGSNVIKSVRIWNTTTNSYDYHDGTNWVN